MNKLPPMADKDELVERMLGCYHKRRRVAPRGDGMPSLWRRAAMAAMGAACLVAMLSSGLRDSGFD